MKTRRSQLSLHLSLITIKYIKLTTRSSILERRNFIHLIGIFLIIALLGAGNPFLYGQTGDGSSEMLPLRLDPEEHAQERAETMEVFIENGIKAMEEGEFDEAILQLQRALQIEPENTEAQNLLDEAIAGYLNDDEDSFDGNGPVYDEIPEPDIDEEVLEKQQEAQRLYEEGEYEEALKKYEAILEEVDEEMRVHIEEDMAVIQEALEEEEEARRLLDSAERYEEEGDYARALSLYEELQALQPDEEWEEKVEELSEVIEELEREEREEELEEEERYAELMESARNYEEDGAWEDALDKYIQAQQIKPEADEVRDGIVRAREEIEEKELTERLEDALSDARQAFEDEDYEGALNYVESALEVDPENEEALELKEEISLHQEVSDLLQQGYEALEVENIEGAKDIGKELTELDPQNPDVKSFLIDVKEKEEALEIEDEHEELQRLLSRARQAYEDGLYEQSKNYAEQAASIDPDDAEVVSLLEKVEGVDAEERIAELKKQVVIFEKAGDYERALEKTEEILEIDPQEPEATAWVEVFEQRIEQLEKEKQEIADRMLEENISELMDEAKEAFEEGEIGTAREKWEQVLTMKPTHKDAQAYLDNTEEEYQEYLEDVDEREREREKERIAREKLYTPITISFTDIKIADFLNQVSLLSDVDFVIPHGGDARVSGRFSETPLVDVLNAVLIPNGFVYSVDGALVKVELNLRSQVFQLSDYETAQLQNLEDQNIISEILYGPDREPTIPGQRYLLDGRRNMMVLTDTALNVQKMENLLENLPEEVMPELVTRMYTVRQNVGPKVKMLLESLLEAETTPTERQIPGRKVLYESSTETLIVRDTLRNIELAENFLMDREFIEKVEDDELTIQSFPVVDEKLLETDPQRAQELARKTTELVRTMLYHDIGETRAREEGRQTWLNEEYGTLTILDTKTNIEKVSEFLVTQPWRAEEEITEIIYVDYVDPGELHAKLEEVLGVMDVRDPRQVGPDSIVRRLRPDQSFRFRDAQIECLRIRDVGPDRRDFDRDRDDWRQERDFAGEVTLLISTPTEVARTVTVREREGVQQIGDYVIRVPDANPTGRGWADVEVQYLPRDVMMEEPEIMPEVEPPPITITPDQKSSALIVRAHDPGMLNKVKFWIERLDVPIPQVTIETRYVTVAEQAMKTLESSLSVSEFRGGFTLDDADASFRFGGTGVDPIAPLIGGGGTAVSPALSGFQPAGTTFDLSTRGMPVRWTLDLLESKGIARVVTGPQLTILNNETGTFEIMRTFSVIQQLSYTDVTYEDRDISEMLFTITPQVTRRNIINMDIQIDMTEYIPGTPELDAGGRRDDDAMFDVDRLTLQPTRDEEKIRSIDTRVQLDDGETIVLGGFKTEHTQDTVSRVPILGDIPLIGRVLFGRQHQVRNTDNLLIFLTAYLRQQ